MRQLLSFILVALILVACGGAATPDVEVTIQAGIAATQIAQPADTPIPPTATPTTSRFEFRDDFEGELAPGWQWIGEDATHWNLLDAPGALRIILQPGNIFDGVPRNFLVYAVPQGNFELATLMNFTPTSNFQFAGLLIYQGQGNAMQFGRAFADCGAPTACPGNAIFFDVVEAGQGGVKPNFATVVASEGQAYLRLRREGSTYTGYYSEDGVEWIMIGQHESTIAPAFVGLIGSQAYQEETTADFDYFTIEAVP